MNLLEFAWLKSSLNTLIVTKAVCQCPISLRRAFATPLKSTSLLLAAAARAASRRCNINAVSRFIVVVE